ncbi:MAG: phosphoglycolate phosphatase [Pseudomonadota bacterium]
MTDLAGVVVVFDLDGTLADTAPDLAGAMNAVLAAAGRPTLPVELVRHLVGHGARALIEKGFTETGTPCPVEEMDRHIEIFLKHYRAHIADATILYPDLLKALDDLAAAGASLAVCTNKKEDLAVQLLDALNLSSRFSAVVGGDTLPVRKPAAEPLLEAVRRSDGDASRAIMVGDSSTDVGAAKAASMPVIAVTFGYSDIPVKELQADRLISHYDDLLGVVCDLVKRL